MSKTSILMKKVSIALSGGIAIGSLTSCGTSQQYSDTTETYYESSESTQPDYESSYDPIETESEETTSNENNVSNGTETNNTSTDITYDETEGYEENYIEEMPYDENCAEWEFDSEDGVWICNDSSSSFYQNFFFLGTYYATKNLLHNNNDFKQYKSTGFIPRTSSSPQKSGFGGGVSGG